MGLAELWVKVHLIHPYILDRFLGRFHGLIHRHMAFFRWVNASIITFNSGTETGLVVSDAQA